LKETLVRRFGEASREVVEAEVEGRLAGRKQIEREDLDAIERSVLAASRQRRGIGERRGGRGSTAGPGSRSVPNLAAATEAPATPPSVVRRSAPAPPRPTGTPPPPILGSTTRRGLTPQLGRSSSEAFVPKPPFGLSMTDVNDTGSERSRVKVVPRYHVPMRPKLKPMDHWDLIVAFDSEKYKREEEAFYAEGRGANKNHFKGVLDTQMIEINGIREQERQAKEKERTDMLDMIEENKRLAAAEHHVEETKKATMKKANDQMTAALNERREKQRVRKEKEQQAMTDWLANEKQRKEEEEQAEREEYARRCKKAKEEREQAYEEAQRAKKAREEAERSYIAEQVQAADDAQAERRAAVQARMDVIERNCATLGAKIKERDAKAEADLEAKVKRVQEETDRLAKEDSERRQSTYNTKVKEMLSTLNVQMQQRVEDAKVEQEANAKQAEIWRKDLADSEAKERQKEANMREARQNQDNDLIKQIRAQTSVHPRNFAMTGVTQGVDLAYNRLLFQQMVEEGFREDITGQLLGKAAHTGKIDPFPSVGRYDGHIHPMEQTAADF